ncbi:Ig-like and fibronectin type-III domain-containing protein 2 [Eumeta japonica]|uniref:Ig-like and fibronectin type-III domain-containing protein 2 n=1 Tax=Eumeta variegata TaxID=151549 RepID=A0A4C1X2K5_EUMVA|nr:Ig-like and fibronectin type-III domain-containing protein 2 [Eumeta japonica]
MSPDTADEGLQGPGIAKGGDVWALVIRAAAPSDAGLYVCELNSDPPVRSFHRLTVSERLPGPLPFPQISYSFLKLRNALTSLLRLRVGMVDVISRRLTPPENTNATDSYSASATPFYSHNYVNCCTAANVSLACLGFCSVDMIMEGTGQDPEACQPDFPAIVKCMADGRNHVPCCAQQRVPDICQDVCRGEFTPVTDNIKTHYSCATYMDATLYCIVEGIALLPSPPEDVEVEPLNEKQLGVSWKPPTQNGDSLIRYVVNVTTLRSFDAHLIDPSESSLDNDRARDSPTTSHQVEPNKTYLVLNNLLPFTMYEITVTSFNIHGSSLPSYAVRSLTLTPGKMKQTEVAAAPELPDVRACCVDAGVEHAGCLDKLCDPTKTFEIGLQVTDLMICAPWAGITFGCLANGLDHTPCCRSRGLPDSCLPLCNGNITNLDFNYFKCLRYMSSYTNCLLQGYGVLPGPPSRLHLTNIDTDYAVVHWAPPAALADTVSYYNLHYRTLEEGDDYRVIERVRSPYILEDLESNTDYEIFVEAVNEHGVGEASSRLIFRTQSQLLEDEIEEANAYNISACCERVQLATVCTPLCSYDAKMSDLRRLAPLCAQEFHKLLRCGAGGRNHESCCERRGVPPNCRGVCSGTFGGGINTCMAYIGNIVQCFEEGTGALPGPPREVHALILEKSKLLLSWSPPEEGTNATFYTVHWQKVDNNSQPYYYNTLQLDNSLALKQPKFVQQLNVTDTMVRLENLEPDALYHMFVVAVNDNGTSLPSSLLLLNMTEQEAGQQVAGIPSPPHSLAVSSHSATWLTVSWQPPQFSQPDEKISYTNNPKPDTILDFKLDYIFYTGLILNSDACPIFNSGTGPALDSEFDPNFDFYPGSTFDRHLNIVLDSGTDPALDSELDPNFDVYPGSTFDRHLNIVLDSGTDPALDSEVYSNFDFYPGSTFDRHLNIVLDSGTDPALDSELDPNFDFYPGSTFDRHLNIVLDSGTDPALDSELYPNFDFYPGSTFDRYLNIVLDSGTDPALDYELDPNFDVYPGSTFDRHLNIVLDSGTDPLLTLKSIQISTSIPVRLLIAISISFSIPVPIRS